MAADDSEAQAFIVVEVVAGVERTAEADVEACLHIDEALLRGTVERGAMCNRGPKVCVPRVDICVEVEHRDRPASFGYDAKQSEGDCVVAADSYQPLTVMGQCGGGLLDLRDGFSDIRRIRGDVPGVSDLLSDEWLNILHLIWPEHPGRLAHVSGTETRARAITDTAVERHSDDHDLRTGYVFKTGKSGEGCDTGITGNQVRV